MKRVAVFFAAAVLVVAVAAIGAAFAAQKTDYTIRTRTTTSRRFELEGKVIAIRRRSIDVSVTRVLQGEAKLNAQLRIFETRGVQVWENGTRVSLRTLEVGQIVRVAGTEVMRGSTVTYRAASVTIEH